MKSSGQLVLPNKRIATEVSHGNERSVCVACGSVVNEETKAAC